MPQHAVMLQRILLLGLVGGLLLLSLTVLKYFIVPLLWAAIIAYSTWGIYQRIDRACGQRRTLSALVMTALVMLMVGVPVILGILILQNEGQTLIQHLQQQLNAGRLRVPAALERLPMIGSTITRLLNDLNQDPQAAIAMVKRWLQMHLGYGRYVLSGIVRNLGKFLLTLFSLFFLYRDGETLVAQFKRAIELIIGQRVHDYFVTISDTVRAVVYGIGLTAIAQALLAGVSYVAAGMSNPLLLTLMTFMLALVPFGPPMAYGSVALWLFSQGQTNAAIGVFLWGVLVVSSADNVIRPLVISGATQIPLLFIMFGVLGGIASFGLLGIFLGPVILAVLLAVWREWLHQTHLDTPSIRES